jgi:RNA polymerase sigma factor (sigma-70 family)
MIVRSDTDLIALARAGDKVAFGLLVKRHQLMVRRIARKMVRNEHLAQEMMQETFLQAYLSLDQLRDDGRFQGWLYGITLNVCKSYLRLQKVNLLSLESLTGGMRVDPAVLSAVAPDPGMILEQRELRRLVLDAVTTLSPRNRVATLLFYYEQLTIGEIAALLGISTSAVKVRLYRSRQHLRLSLASLYPETSPAMQPLPTKETLVIKPERTSDMVKVTVVDVIKAELFPDIPDFLVGLLDKSDFLVVLLDKSEKRLLPIWIGPAEGMAMALNLLDVSFQRPVTYTFMANLLEASGVELEDVSISALTGETYIATVTLRFDETVQEVDARPSDAINLALQMERPIYVDESVMDKAGIDISDRDGLPQGTGLRQLKQDWDKRMQQGEEKRQAFLELSDEERRAMFEKMTEQGVTFLLGPNPDQAVD